MKLNDLWRYYDRDHLGTIRDPRRPRDIWTLHLEPSFGFMDHKKLAVGQINTYILKRGKAAKATISREIGVLVACLKWNMKQGRIRDVPYLPRPTATGAAKILAPEDVQALLAVRHPYAATVRLALLTGQRLSALLDLTWERVYPTHIDFRTPEARASGRMKGRAVIPLTGQLLGLIDRLRHEADGPFVLHQNGARIQWRDPEWKRLCKAAGIKANFHMLRHTVASRILANGGRLEEVKQLLAHKNIRTTEDHYIHLQPNFLKGAIDRLTFEDTT